MTRAIELHTERLILKPLSMLHLSEKYVSWLNDPEVNMYLDNGGDYTMEKLNQYLEEVENKNIYFWGIHLKENLKHIGNIKIDPIYEEKGYGEYGILMGDKSEWNKGYAKEASLCIINFCFNAIDLKKITLGVIENNFNAVQLYINLGFVQEQFLENHGIYNNMYCNCFRMGLSNPKVEFNKI